MTRPNSATVRALVAHLNDARAKGRSWGMIAMYDFPAVDKDGQQIVKRGTLCRIAKSGGEYLPKNAKILKALGLLGERRKQTETEKRISKMARQTKKAVLIVRKK
jgi:hypothetical protein